jgi:hypothetical protein
MAKAQLCCAACKGPFFKSSGKVPVEDPNSAHLRQHFGQMLETFFAAGAVGFLVGFGIGFGIGWAEGRFKN